MNRPDDARREREFAALDRLLDAQPEPRPPAGLAERVLAATAAERARGAADGEHRTARRTRRVAAFGLAGASLAAAAALLLWFAGPEWSRRGSGDTGAFGPGPRVASAEPIGVASVLPTSPELLAELELLEDWELLVTDDLDLLLAELDELDELLIELPTEPVDGEEQG